MQSLYGGRRFREQNQAEKGVIKPQPPKEHVLMCFLVSIIMG